MADSTDPRELNVTIRNLSANVLPWFIPAGPDGLEVDSVLIAVMEGSEMMSISLRVHRAGLPDVPLPDAASPDPAQQLDLDKQLPDDPAEEVAQ